MISYTTAAFLCLVSLWIGGAIGVFCMALVCAGERSSQLALDPNDIDRGAIGVPDSHDMETSNG